MKVLIAFVIILIVEGCKTEPVYKNMEEAFKDYFVLNEKNLRHATIHILDEKGAKVQEIPLSKSGLPDGALVLSSISGNHHLLTTSEWVKTNLPPTGAANLPDAGPLPSPNCELTWIYDNITVETEGKGNSMYLQPVNALPVGMAPSVPPADKVWVVTSNKKTLYNVYLCTITYTGVIVCENDCDCPPCITCNFISDGLVISDVARPMRDADHYYQDPCGVADCD